jgi:Tol biopolymer transport system component
MDWKSRKMRVIPGSGKLVRGAWSPDGQHIAATDGVEMQLFDFRTGRWTLLARGRGMGPPFWARNGASVYYQNSFEPEQPIWRVAINGGKLQKAASSLQIPQSGMTAYSLAGLAPDDAPIASVARSNSDIYALELELP